MRTALVVDDSAIEVLMTKNLLGHLGYTVFTASGGEEALRLIHECAPQVVVCDITMPGMSGLELLEATRRFVRPPAFIMATGLDDAELAVTALHGGAYGYLTKPLKEAPLRAALEDALSRQKIEWDAKQERERLTKLDPLTGLLNKDEFLRSLGGCMDSLRKADYPLALLFANVDGLRYVNNTYGHYEGDQVLQHVARILRQSVRPGDVVARYGGDVFALALTGIEQAHIEVKARAICSAVEHASVTVGGREYSLTITIGAATAFLDVSIDAMVNNADLALMLAKGHGRNQFYLYCDADESHRREFGAQLNNLQILRGAIEAGRFEMHYQPIVDLKTGETRHFEALIRLRDEAGKVLPPDVFIKVAEAFDLAIKIDCMVVETCIRKLGQLAAAGNSVGMSINLSGKSVGNADLLALIEREVAAASIDASRIIFEITETAAFHNLEAVQQFVRDVKRLGCRFALDDFGVGFSSFYYIKQLDIDYLKIDGSFIRNLCESANDRVFVQAMVEISRVFGMQVIAEWVENVELASLLREIGVDYGQGYYFGRPAPECIAPAVALVA